MAAPAFAQTAVQSGDWNAPATWGGMVPAAQGNQAVDVPAGITVTIPAGYDGYLMWSRFTLNGSLVINGAFTAGDLLMRPGSSLTINSGGKFTGAGTFWLGGTVVNRGTILAKKDFDLGAQDPNVVFTNEAGATVTISAGSACAASHSSARSASVIGRIRAASCAPLRLGSRCGPSRCSPRNPGTPWRPAAIPAATTWATASGVSVISVGSRPVAPSRAWAAQIWASPWELINDSTATPLATAIGSVTSGTLTIGFTPSQVTATALDLSPVVGTNNFWLVIGGQDTDGNQQIVRAGTIEINPCPWTTTGLSNSVGITVANDYASFVYDGNTYQFPVALAATPPVTPDGIAVDDDSAFVDFGGSVYSAPTAVESPTPAEAIEGELVVVNDNLIVLLDGVAYTIPVQQV